MELADAVVFKVYKKEVVVSIMGRKYLFRTNKKFKVGEVVGAAINFKKGGTITELYHKYSDTLVDHGEVPHHLTIVSPTICVETADEEAIVENFTNIEDELWRY